MSTTVSFVIETDESARLWFTATFQRDEEQWSLSRAKCDRGNHNIGQNVVLPLDVSRFDAKHWLNGWIAGELQALREPRVYWLVGSGFPSERTQCLWEMIDQQRAEDNESAVDEDNDAERLSRQLQEFYSSGPVYGRDAELCTLGVSEVM